MTGSMWDLSYSDIDDLRKRCDTSFYLWVKNPKVAPDPIEMWRYCGESYSYDEINFLLVGYGSAQAGLPIEGMYAYYYARENGQTIDGGDIADIILAVANPVGALILPNIGDGWGRTTTYVQPGAVWFARGYYGL